MAIDMRTEELVLLKKAAKLFATPDNRKGPHVASLYRWIDGKPVKPRKGGEPVVVRLESLLIGGDRYTSAEAVQRFCEAETAARDGESAAPAIRATRERQRDVNEARKTLARAGI